MHNNERTVCHKMWCELQIESKITTTKQISTTKICWHEDWKQRVERRQK